MASSDGFRRMVTMREVAEAADVSPMTVSNTFRYPGRVQEDTRQRVEDVARQLGYVPNMSAGHLAAGKSRLIGSTIPSVKNSSFYQYISGLEEAADAAGKKLVFMLTESPEQEFEAVRALIGLRVSGLILIGNEHTQATVGLLRRSGIPLVETWLLHDPIDKAIGYDIAAAVRAACRHHIKAGRRRIGLVSHDDPASRRFRERPPVFRAEMRAAGLRDDLIVDVAEPHGFEAGSEALDSLLSLDSELDAVICPTDIVAAGIIFECNRRNIAVPQKIGIIGWGDYEIASAIAPKLTTVKPNPKEIGSGAVELLFRQENQLPGQSVDTGFDLIERETAL
ncbi:LacI family DNA-binding transcriptional regulator [Mesorhizobium sp. DCY119]|uniref:LacI family DNA-binding transcriptional regulator n=1 Tax=Mesorhizobium sp. DCY119 TaxID=2108445 RepID=UPI000E7525D1|nr:LacI family DNA-binding transcriptional regulator [Mesorhizobium sp. DCY119]RJG41437.1 LacI family DNA-binding transcriptional regulator [Mesorhizobium sp. DCY119]